MSIKTYAGLIHVSIFINELDQTGELGQQINPFNQSGLSNLIIKSKVGDLETVTKDLRSKLDKIQDIKNANNEM